MRDRGKQKWCHSLNSILIQMMCGVEQLWEEGLHSDPTGSFCRTPTLEDGFMRLRWRFFTPWRGWVRGGGVRGVRRLEAVFEVLA